MKDILRFFLRPRARYVLAWLLAGIAAAITLFCSWTIFDTPRKEDGTSKRKGGNNGHAMIDFGGQWLMGRMLVQGLGRHLYHRNYLREVVGEAYPREDEIPLEERTAEEGDEHEADNMMHWLVGRDDPEAATALVSFLAPLAARDAFGVMAFAGAEQERVEQRVREATVLQVGGALYPPIHVLFMYPLGQLPPRQAYRVMQVLGILLALLAGWGIRLLSQGRIWWPMGVVAVILFPGFDTTMNLGQNSIIMLTLLIWGWTLIAGGRPVCGGIVWGLLAFKPVWAAAFFLVPVLTQRWRVCLAMLTTGFGLAVLTLPLVGWQTWLDWLHVGCDATTVYNMNRNWVFLSRDLLSIPRRWLLDFKVDPVRDSLAATVIGWGLLLSVLACTVGLSIFRKDQRRAVTGPPAAFLLLGAWLSCYHFMYYDVLLTALPIVLLLTEPRRYLEPVLVAVTLLPENARKSQLAYYYHPGLDCTLPSSASWLQVGYRNICVRNSMTLSLIALLAISDLFLPLFSIEVAISAPLLKNGPFPLPITYSTTFDGTPWPTFCILALWAWCGWLWLWMPRSQTKADPARPENSDRLPDVMLPHAAQLV